MLPTTNPAMAVTAKSAGSPAEDVPEQLKSWRTTNASTLKLLRGLLGVDQDEQPAGTRNVSRPVPKAFAKTPARGPMAKGVKSRSNQEAEVTIYEPPGVCKALSSEKQRSALATVAFNKTLKILSTTVKSQSMKGLQAHGQGDETPRSGIGRAAPLQLTSPNLQRNQQPPAKPNAHVFATASPSTKELSATAECASAALECLRRCRTWPKSEEKFIDLQLEKGALIYIEHLCSLELLQLAMMEAQSLKKELDLRLRHDIQSKVRHEGRKVLKITTSANMTIVAACVFEAVPESKDLLQLLVAFQRAIVKIVSQIGTAKNIEAMLEVLSDTKTYGPCTLLIHARNFGLLPAEKARVHMQALANMLAMLCKPSFAGSETNKFAKSAPHTEFGLRLQMLSMQCQCLAVCTTTEDMTEDIDRRIWTPFGKAAAAYCRASREPRKETFRRVKEGLQTLEDNIHKEQHIHKLNGNVLLPVTLTTSLAKLAQDLGCLIDSAELLQRSQGHEETAQGLTSVVYRCSLATVRLQAVLENPPAALAASDEALRSLQGSIKGSAKELDDVLVQGVRLRKSAQNAFSVMLKSTEFAPLVDIQTKLQVSSLRILFAFGRFVLRYIGHPPANTAEELSVSEHYEQKVRKLSSVMESTLSGALGVIHQCIEGTLLPWDELDHALSDCLALAQVRYNADVVDVLSEAQARCSIWLKVSNLYWLGYLKLKDQGVDLSKLTDLLKRSIVALEKRPNLEQHLGFLATKYEKMASLQTSLQTAAAAQESLTSAIACYLARSEVRDAINQATLYAVPVRWNESDPVLVALGKTLAAYVTLGMASQGSDSRTQAFYDDGSLPLSHRCLLLEKQFVAYYDISSGDASDAIVATLVEILLKLQEDAGNSLLRLRLLVKIAKFTSKHDNKQVEALLDDALAHDSSHELGAKDSMAAPILASVQLHRCYKASTISVETVRNFIDAWLPFVLKQDRWTLLEAAFDESIWIADQIVSAVTFADMQGLTKLQLSALLVQQHIFEHRKQAKSSAYVRCCAQIGVQYARLGKTVEAGRAIARANKLLQILDPSPSVLLEVSQCRVEYLLQLGNLEQCSQALQENCGHYQAHFRVEDRLDGQKANVRQTQLLATSMLMMSRMSLETGDVDVAILSARRCARLSSHLWTTLQRKTETSQHSEVAPADESSVASISEDISKMAHSQLGAPSTSAPKGSAFWPFVSLHCEALMHVSSLSAHCGLYQDAICYAEQAQKISHAANSRVFSFRANTLLTSHKSKAVATMEGSRVEERPCFRLSAEETDSRVVKCAIDAAEACLAGGYPLAASERLEEAKRLAANLDTVQLRPFMRLEPSEQDLTNVMDSITISKTKSRMMGASRTLAARCIDDVDPASRVSEPATQSNLERAIEFLETFVTLRMNNWMGAKSTVETLRQLSDQPATIQWRLVEASAILQEVLQSLSEDAVHCVLGETTIALPALYPSKVASKPAGKSATKTPSKSRAKAGTTQELSASERPAELVDRALDLLKKANWCKIPCTTSLLRDVCRATIGGYLLSSVLSKKPNPPSAHAADYATLLANVARSHEQVFIRADNFLADHSRVWSWSNGCEQGNADGVESQTDYVASGQYDISTDLPETWNVLSMGLSQDHNELLLTKFRAGQPPFLLRVPLRRSNSEGAEAEDFDFALAKQELSDVVKNANATAHDARGQSDRKGWQAWRQTREALDARLKSLLDDIENIWFGGFKGMLSNQGRQEDLLSRFGQSLIQILDKHLPSRQKMKQANRTKPQLHAHVLELFVALGHPDLNELTDSVADLLYFVVDILQFQAEHNAYDEIDFDMITMEVLDALRGYHEAREKDPSESQRHTILVLDKELLGFPWESLPCLRYRSVSRMPSVSAIKSRLDIMASQENGASCLSVDAGKGSFVLNPSGDLMSTQATFTKPFLDSLPGWRKIIGQAPSEADFESCLRDNDIFVYFGHGSGAQYIRARHIKRLQKCAVTFLMGCSSGKMNECGAFEPYGVPWNYMHAGAPAVVGALWDVTDKDIDRFAMKTFIEWGLLPDENLQDDASKSKRKAKAAQPTPRREAREESRRRKGQIGLDEAVAKARDACILKYLNGAAPVIYGIPVVLK